MVGFFDDPIAYLQHLFDPTAALNTPTVVPTGTAPTVVPPSGSRPPLTLGSPMLGGPPPAAAPGGLLGGQGLLGTGQQGLLGNSIWGKLLGGALSGLGSVQPGQTGLAALGAGAAGATQAAEARQQQQMRDWYMQNQMQQSAQNAADEAAKKKAQAAYIASLPPDQQLAASVAPAEFVSAGLKGADAPKTRMLPQGDMEIPQDWDPNTRTWVTTGPPAPRWAPPSPGSSVSVNMPTMESSASKAAGDVIGKDVGTVITEGRQAATNIANYDRLQSLLDQVHTGKYTGTIVDLKKAALAAGIDLSALGIADNTAVADAARAMSNQMALKLRGDPSGGMPGAMSDSDRNFLSSMTPNIENTPEGNKLMIEWSRRVEQRKEQQAAVARNYIKSHGGNIDAGVYDEWQKYADAHPLFGDADRQAAAAAAAGGGQGMPTAQDLGYNTLAKGDTATNPQTGERKQWDGTKWVPLSKP